MKLYIFILLIILLSCSSDDQIDENLQANIEETISKVPRDSLKVRDTVVPDLIAPKGTQMLADSKKTFYVNDVSPYFLKHVTLSECNESEGYPSYADHNQLQSINWTDSTLTIDFSIVETCGSDFLCEVEMIDNNTLNLIYHQYNSLATCNCCYGLKYTFLIHEYYQPESYGQLDDLPNIKFVAFDGKNIVKLK